MTCFFRIFFKFTFDDVVDDDFCEARDRDGDRLFVSPLPLFFISIRSPKQSQVSKKRFWFLPVSIAVNRSAHFS